MQNVCNVTNDESSVHNKNCKILSRFLSTTSSANIRNHTLQTKTRMIIYEILDKAESAFFTITSLNKKPDHSASIIERQNVLLLNSLLCLDVPNIAFFIPIMSYQRTKY